MLKARDLGICATTIRKYKPVSQNTPLISSPINLVSEGVTKATNCDTSPEVDTWIS